MPDPSVAIVILYLDQREALIACLQSCGKIDYDNYEIIVVENGSLSVQDWREAMGSAGPVRVVWSATNIGYARGNNLGIRDAWNRGAAYILLLNDDTVVAPEFLRLLVAAGEQAPDVGALGPAIFHLDDPTKIWFAGAKFDRDECDVRNLNDTEWAAGASRAVRDSDYVTGCCVLMKRGTIDRVGLLDERFFLYWEDTDWGLRVKASGLRNVVVPTARIWHRVSVSSGGVDSPLRVYHKTRSHLFFARRYAPAALPKVHKRFMRDVAWLALKSRTHGRLTVARAIASAVRDFHLRRTGAGPAWLWRKR